MLNIASNENKMIIHQRIPESELRILNKKLIDYYGRTENFANFRVVWSEDQLEKRLCTHTNEGWSLLQPEMREVPKYKQWIQNKYILEGLTAVPDFQSKELATKLSYEPIWVFEKDNEAVYPSWGAVRFVLDNLKAKATGTSYVRYKDPAEDPEKFAYEQKKEIDSLHEEMFGNETQTADALAYKEGIVVPGGQNGSN